MILIKIHHSEYLKNYIVNDCCPGKGEQNIFDKIGYFGTDKPFNHFSNLETTGKPLNPMMNAGAILTTSLIDGEGEVPFKKYWKWFVTLPKTAI